MNSVLIVGASLAGVAAAEELRRLGFGGSIIMVGDEIHLPYDRPPLSKQVMNGEYSVEQCALRDPGWARSNDVEIRLGSRAADLDVGARRVTLAHGGQVDFDAMVIATGATPVTLPGAEMRGVHTLRTLDDALAIRDALASKPRVVVVGGGFIGAEVAAAAIAAGAEVTIVESLKSPLARVLGEEFGAFCSELHGARGVTVRCGVAVSRLEGDDHVERVVLRDGSVIQADLVVVGLGVRPATKWLENSEIVLNDGVECDAFCRTSAPGIVAAGDVARWAHPTLGSIRIEHWENAVSQGQTAAKTLVDPLNATPYAPIPYVWSDQYGEKIQVAGWPQPDDAFTILEESSDPIRFVAAYSRGGMLTGVVTINRRTAIRSARKLLADDATLAEAVSLLS